MTKMKTVAVLPALLVVMAVATTASAQTVLTSAVYGGHTYSLLSQSNWTDAESKAASMGGHLATINEAAENRWLFDTFARYGGVDRNLWIGLNDAAQNGTFVWASGETSTYRNWYPGEPNDYFGGGSEPYVHLFAPNLGLQDYTWNDAPNISDWEPLISGRKQLFGVVEVNAIPEPASFAILGLGSLTLVRRRRFDRSHSSR